ncbi:hypothetical protein Sango_0915500 [Sesamum angolense]|uniref:Uncharacterized protein n=1 Tax=Sesamum angolense TaxID=2727404 RepID=A0AAE2BXV7_9LAMI|nr:hypothetical protein Sango_0915500 [Sesamum angolense]
MKRREARVESKLENYGHNRNLLATKGKVHWLKSGDRNTTFFRAETSTRRWTNFITKLRNDDGAWVEEPKAIQHLIERHFLKVFEFDRPSVTDIERGIEHLTCKVDYVTTLDLVQPFTVEEEFGSVTLSEDCTKGTP